MIIIMDYRELNHKETSYDSENLILVQQDVLVASSSSNDIKIPNPRKFNKEKQELNLDLICSICLEDFTEPTINKCGHTFCFSCVKRIIEHSEPKMRQCPKCAEILNSDTVIPNFAVQNLMKRVKKESLSVHDLAEGFHALQPSQNIIRVLRALNYNKLNFAECNNLIKEVQQERQALAFSLEKYKFGLLNEFLTHLSSVKTTEINQLHREKALIIRDIVSLTTNNFDAKSPYPILMRENNDDDENTIGIGFNTFSSPADTEQRCIAAKKKRMNLHMKELVKVYFDCKKEININGDNCDNENNRTLANFGKILNNVTQYHRLKPLATFSVSGSEAPSSNDNNHDINVVSNIDFDKDGQYFAVTNLMSKKIKVMDYVAVISYSADDKQFPTSSNELLCKDYITCFRWNRYYKNSLVSSDFGGCLSLWDVETSNIVRIFAEHEKRIRSVDWSEDHRLFVSASDDYKIKLWSTDTHHSLANIHTNFNVYCVQCCPDNTFLIALGCLDHNIYFYDFRKPQTPLCVLPGHNKAVTDVRFISKNELISVSKDGTTCLWNTQESQSCVKSFKGHVNDKYIVGLATNGNYIATGSEDNSVYVYSKHISSPLFSYKFDEEKSRSVTEDKCDFISAVTWKKKSPVLLAGNSEGFIKIFEFV